MKNIFLCVLENCKFFLCVYVFIHVSGLCVCVCVYVFYIPCVELILPPSI